MSGLGFVRRAVWLLPIVMIVAALMVLPGGAIFSGGSAGGHPTTAMTGTSATPAPSASALPEASTGPATAAEPSSAVSTPSASALSPPTSFSPPSAFSPASGSSRTSNLASSLPQSLQNEAWIQDLLHPHAGVAPLASVPNLGMLEHPQQVGSNGLAYPSYQAAPAPLGIADYGLGVTPYAYNASYMDGQVTFSAPPNVTQPAATNVIGTSAAFERLGYVGSEYEFGIQLNTIGVNLTIPGTYNAITNDWSGYVWAQNVVNWNDSGLHFVQDTWNFSLGSGGNWNDNSIYSGCGGNTSHANYILYLYGVFQCSESNIPLTTADYPITLSLYNNFTTNAQGRSQLVYGYNIYEGGSGTTLSGIADTVVFNNTVPSYVHPRAPSNAPANSIDPFSVAPYVSATKGAQIDSELDIVGGIEGDNGVFSAINGSAQLMYANATSDVFKDVPSAYNFGTDTGETSYGIADYWTPSHVLEIHQGPSMLYGLWNAEPQASVPSGDVQISGSISPSYGFVFVSNTPPVLYPWAETETDNMSWLPTSSTGAFNTYLPPLGAPWTTTYYLQAFADGYQEYNGTVTAATTSLAIDMTASPGVLNAPLYMNGNAQAAALAAAIGGSGTAPYTFGNLVVNVNMSFDRLNDWSFPTFEVFQSEAANSVVVNNVTLGSDSNGRAHNSYIWDYSILVGTVVSPGFFTAPEYVLPNVPDITSGIDVYFGTNDEVQNQTVEYLCPYNPAPFILGQSCLGVNGFQVTLWGDSGAGVLNTTAYYARPGVFVGGSVDTLVRNTQATGEYGVTDMGSVGTMVESVSVNGALGINAYSSVDSAYSWINVTNGGEGIAAGTDYGSNISHIYDPPGTVGLTVNELSVTGGSLGANLTFSTGTTFTAVTVDGVEGVRLEGSPQTSVNDLVVNNSIGVLVFNSTGSTITDLVATNGSSGAFSESSQDVTVQGATVTDSGGVEYFQDPTAAGSASAFNVKSQGLGVEALSASGLSVSQVQADASAGVFFSSASADTATGLTATNGSVGAIVTGCQGESVSGVSVSDASMGVEVSGGQDNSVSGVSASDLSIGVLDDGGFGDHVSGVTATNSTLSSPYARLSYFGEPIAAVVTDATTQIGVSNVTTTTYPAALYDLGSNTPSVSGVNASAGAYGLLLNGTYAGTFTAIDTSRDTVGVQFAAGARNNVLSGGSFTDDSSYAVSDLSTGSPDNMIYQNNFVDNNGATSTYDAAHVQAWSAGVDYYYLCVSPAAAGCAQGIGNYWADWHTYGPNGHLAPYAITGISWDYFPIGPAETFSVTFTETGLSSGASWSVSVNGVTVSGTNASITVPVPMGTFTYSVAASGYSATPSSGSVTISGPGQSVAVSFSSTTSLATTSDLNTYFAAALALAAIALVVALIALFWRRKPKPSATPSPPTAWTPPPAGETTPPPPPGATGGAETSGGSGSSSWSEGTGTPAGQGPGGSESGGPGTG